MAITLASRSSWASSLLVGFYLQFHHLYPNIYFDCTLGYEGKGPLDNNLLQALSYIRTEIDINEELREPVSPHTPTEIADNSPI